MQDGALVYAGTYSGSAGTVSANLGGTAALNKTGAGTLTLSASNGYSGATTVSAGTLVLANSSAAGQTTVAVNVTSGLQFASGIGTFNVGGLSGGSNFTLADLGASAVTLSVGGNGQTTAYSGVMSGSGGNLIKVGTGMLTLSGSNSYTGGTTTVNGGTLRLNTGGQVGVIRGTLTINPSGTVVLQATNALGYFTASPCVPTVNIIGAAIIQTAANGINGYTTNFNLTGGTMSSPAGGTFHFSNGYGVNTYASTATSLISSAIVVRDGGTMNFNVASGTAANGIDLLVSGNIGDLTYVGGVEGIIKTGAGLMSLSGSNSYNGATTISGGVLNLASSAALPGGNISFGGGTLQYSNINTLDYSAQIKSSSARSPSTPTTRT